MVEIAEILDVPVAIPASEERLLDAQEIEAAAANLKRPTAKMQLESLAKKLRKESEALKRLEASQAKAKAETTTSAPVKETALDDDEAPIVEDVTNESKAAPAPTASKPAPPPPVVAPTAASARYVPIATFAFDSGKYDSPTVSVYVSMDGVKGIPRENITCDFTPSSFDLIVRDLQGKSYRLFKENLAHDIHPETSKCVVKKDRLVVKLGKSKGEYGYDTWTDLIDKKKGKGDRDASGKRKKEDPQESIMSLMKNMYDTGDDNMKKIIGETMEKQRRGDLGKDDMTSGIGGMGL
jgi:calcyclin binding protein